MNTEKNLRNALIKLAYEKPEYRAHLLPLLEKEARAKEVVAGIGAALVLALGALGVRGCSEMQAAATGMHDASNKPLTFERIVQQPAEGKKALIEAVIGKKFDTEVKPEMEKSIGVDSIDYKSALDSVAWDVVRGKAMPGITVNFINKSGRDYYQVLKNGSPTGTEILIRH